MSEIKMIKTQITTLNRDRLLRIYLPSNYNLSTKKFPVLYMHDGQNIYEKSTSAYHMSWEVHNTIDRFEQEYGKSLIVVGIDNGGIHRLDEYSQYVNSNLGIEVPHLNIIKAGGEGDKYLEWLVNELIPYIDNNYRTNKTNYLAGSSMGGNISYYAGLKYPEIFSKIGIFSPAFWFSMREFIELTNNSKVKDLGIYMDIGTNEYDDKTINVVDDFKQIYHLLKIKGFENLKIVIEEGANHSEDAWRKRFPIFLEWLFNSNE